jgi:hypothetical protein
MYFFIIMIVVLLSIYLFYNFITPEKPKVVITYYPLVSAKPLIGSASNWKIISFYTEDTFVYGKLVELEEDCTSALILQERLKTNTNSDDCFIRGNSMGNTAILIRNKDNKELYIGWHDNEIRVGDRLHESSCGRIVPITDYIF